MKAQESLGHLLKHSHGPHGGNLLRTPHEIIEVSIFEQAGLAYFRLHFYDHAGHPMPSPSVELINLKTVRQNGEEERFVLRPHDEALCLESMSAVRRPFTFAVNVTIQRTGPSQTCQVNFGEQQATNSQHNDEQPDS